MESPFPNRRPSLRLRDYDYTQIGAYFITLCTMDRRLLFGVIEQDSMSLNDRGKIVQEDWQSLTNFRDNVKLDQFVVMPNHFHAILFITNQIKGTASRAPTKRIFGQPISGSLSAIIGGFKSGVTKRIHRLPSSPKLGVWQRGFFEHVIRNEDSLDRIREYIFTNQLRWDLDRENPQKKGEDEFDRWLNKL